MSDSDAKAFLGIGWAFPVAVDPTGDVALAEHEEDVREAIRIILATDPGERVMRPDFGAGLTAFVFEPITTTTMARVRHQVERSLIEWEPRIDSITVDVSAVQPVGRIDIAIGYRVRSTNTFYNMVYPFYVQEAR